MLSEKVLYSWSHFLGLIPYVLFLFSQFLSHSTVHPSIHLSICLLIYRFLVYSLCGCDAVKFIWSSMYETVGCFGVFCS